MTSWSPVAPLLPVLNSSPCFSFAAHGPSSGLLLLVVPWVSVMSQKVSTCFTLENPVIKRSKKHASHFIFCSVFNKKKIIPTGCLGFVFLIIAIIFGVRYFRKKRSENGSSTDDRTVVYTAVNSEERPNGGGIS